MNFLAKHPLDPKDPVQATTAFRDECRQYAHEAIEFWRETMNDADKPMTNRIACSRLLVAYAHGLPRQSITLDTGSGDSAARAAEHKEMQEAVARAMDKAMGVGPSTAVEAPYIHKMPGLESHKTDMVAAIVGAATDAVMAHDSMPILDITPVCEAQKKPADSDETAG